MIPTSIDGTDITGATIDGQDVQEITVDGQTVFTAEISTDLTIKADHIYDMGEGSGTTFFDSVASANATANFTNWKTGAGVNNAYPEWTANTNNRADTGLSFSTSSDVTISIWFRMSTNGNTGSYLWDHGTATGENNFMSRNDAGTPYYVDGQLGGVKFGVLESNLATNTWHMVTVVYDESANEANAYIDDSLKSTITTNPSWDDQFYIGNRGDNARSMDDGLSFLLIAFDLATQSEIANHFNETKSLFGR